MTAARDFWSRRKAAVAAESQAETTAEREAEAAEARARLDDLSDAEILERLNLPEPESLVSGDDFSAFMQPLVPARLQRRALRSLWRSNPVLANVDGLVDYGEDFTDAATVVDNLKTAYTVGRGMMAHVEHLARAEAERSAPAKSEPEVAQALAEEEPVPEEAQASEDDRAQEEDLTHDEPAAPSPRRMTFRYDSESA